MGQDKALLKRDGRSQLANLVALLEISVPSQACCRRWKSIPPSTGSLLPAICRM
jgi:hypothetical protein